MIQHYPFEVLPLPYLYDSLEPNINMETMFFHHRGYITADGITAGSQSDRNVVRKRDVLRDIGNLRFERQTGSLLHYQILPCVRCKDIILWIAGRPGRSTFTGISSRSHRSGGSLGTLWPGNSLRAGFSPFSGTAGRPRFSPRPHRPWLHAYAGRAGHLGYIL